MNTESGQRWVQASLLVAVRSNLAYWSSQPAAILRRESSNLHSAVRYGLRLPSAHMQAARLLSQSFAVAITQPAAWLLLYDRALRLKALPSKLLGSLLYEHAVLLWQNGLLAEAAHGFEHSQRHAQRNSLAALRIRSLIGLCLVYSQHPAKAERAARNLRTTLGRTRTKSTLRAQAYAALGTAAYFARQHAQAVKHFEGALAHADAGLAQAQLHILAGLCAHALGRTDAALNSYNAAARSLQQYGASATQLARVELLRATAHYHKSNRGQQVRLQPAIAALQRAADLLNQAETDPPSRAQLESMLGRTYTRRGEVARGIQYLSSALELSEHSDPSLAADVFAALQELETKNPA